MLLYTQRTKKVQPILKRKDNRYQYEIMQIWEFSDFLKGYKKAMPTIFHKAKVNTLEMNGKIDVLSREILKRTTEFVILYKVYKNYRKL